MPQPRGVVEARAQRASRPLALLLALALALTGCSGDTELAPPTPTSTDAREATAQRVVVALQDALQAGDAPAAEALAADEARQLLGAVAGNVQALDLRLAELRYLEPAQLPAEELTGRPDGTWGATVELSWRLSGWDQRDSRVETAVLLDRDGRVLGFAPGTGRVPLWLTGPLDVRRSPRVLVLSGADGPGLGVESVRDLGRQAVAEVTQTLGWDGKLVLEVPATEDDLEGALQAAPGQYGDIAAVTTAADGSAGEAAPVHVFLNPALFGRLGGQGAQVVMTHEAVHVATRATASSAPNWLREGFADYVALEHADVPVQKAGAQAIAGVRRNGPPKELPTDAELSASAPGLGAAYEEAWLVCRFIARAHGQEKLIAFYEAVDGGASLAAALRNVLGTSEPALTAAWSSDMARLAG